MWDINDAPQPEAVQAEQEIWSEIVKNDVAPSSDNFVDQQRDIIAARPNLHDRLHREALAQADRDTAAYVERRDGTGTVTFKRLRTGAWGITGPSALVVEGQQVNVSKRDGSVTLVTVGRVLWNGDGKAIAATRR